MKHFILFFLLIPLLSQSQNNALSKNFHHSINTAGGDISGEEGSISFSIGQINYLSYEKTNSSTIEGIQQPLATSLKAIDKPIKEMVALRTYPNPATDYFIVEASNYTNRALTYNLTDLNGNIIKEGRIEAPGSTVDISRLAVAIYLLNITDNNEHIKTFRIIKK